MKNLLILTLLALTVAACASQPAAPTTNDTGGETPAPRLLAAGECVEMIVNGGFESASIEPWVLGSGDILAFDSQAHSGAQSVILGGDMQIYQEFNVHTGANRAEASYWWGGQSAGTLTATLQDTNGNVLATLGQHSGGSGYTEATSDLSDYIGQTVWLSFEAASGSDFSIDDVSVQACGPAE